MRLLFYWNMNYKILITILWIFLLSCNDKRSNFIDNTVSNKQISDITATEKFIKLDSIHLKNYPIQTFSSKNQYEYLIGYNYQTHNLDIINLTQKIIESIPLHGEGPNAIHRDINGIYSNTLDSIWLYSANTAYLLQRDGIIISKINLPVDAGEYIINTTNYSNAIIKIHYHPERNSIFYTTVNPGKKIFFFMNEFSIHSGNVKKTLLEYTDAEDGIGKNYGWMQHPNVTCNDRLIIFNFPFNSNIYVLDIDSGIISKHGGKSSFTDDIANKTFKISVEDWDRHLIENVHFYEVNYDKFRDCYYRIHVNGLEFIPKISFSEQLNNKRLYLTIFDNQFNYVKEIPLAMDSYNVIGGWGVVKTGLLLIKDNPNNLQFNYEELQYDIVSFSLQ